MNTICKRSNLALLAAGLLLASATASAQTEVWLRVQQFNKRVADGSGNGNGTTAVPMWGYRECTASFAACSGPVLSPGPTINMAPGDTTLTVHIQNRLPPGLANITNATSVVIPALPKAMSPVKFTDGDGRERVRSFDTETPRTPAAASEGTYVWENVPAGTYLYHSGTHPQVQVQMGLFGAVVKRASATEAYPGVAIDGDQVLLFSEIDPAIHAAVDTDTYGVAPGPTSTERYHPRFFLINGEAYRPNVDPIDVPAGNVLLRLVNAGIESHAPQLIGEYFTTVAEDGHPLPARHSQYSTLLAAGKTLDVLFAPATAATYPMIDRTLRLANNSTAGGGMFARLRVGNTPGVGNPIAADDLFCVQSPTGEGVCNFEGGNIVSGAINTGAPGVLGNDSDPNGDPIRVSPGQAFVLSGVAQPPATLAVNAGTAAAAGRLAFNPQDPTWVGIASFTYTVTENAPGVILADQLVSAPGTVRIVRDMRASSTVFHNPAGTAQDQWELAGVLRDAPVGGTVTVQFVQNTGNTNCTRVGQGVDGGATPTVVPVTGNSWTFTGLLANPAGCNRIRIEARMPDMPGEVSEHNTALETNFQRVNTPL